MLSPVFFLFCFLVLVTSHPLCFEELKAFSFDPFHQPGEFYNTSRVNNPMYNQRRPAFVSLPRSEQEVAAALQCAVKFGLQVAIKSGGHSFAGYSTIPSPGFMINMMRMARVQLDQDKQIVRVQTGARWRDVYVAFKESGGLWVVTGGLCPSVGVAGFSMGGGVGPTARLFGLAIDNLVNFTMVMANGSRVVTASEDSNPDLFWALRGGGGGNFGVVTELSFRIHQGPEEYSWGTICYEPEPNVTQRALEVLGEIAPELPREVNIDAVLAYDATESESNTDWSGKRAQRRRRTMKALHNNPIKKNTPNTPKAKETGATLCLWVVNNGPKKQLERIMKPFIAATSPSSVNFTSYDCFWEMITDYSILHGYSEYSSEGSFSKNWLLPALSKPVAEVLSKTKLPTNCDFHLLQFGGKISEIPSDSTPFPYRQTTYMTYASCGFQDQEEQKQSQEFLKTWADSLKDFSQGSYLNFIDPFLPDWERMYYGDNIQRLLQIKMKWNPPGISSLRFPQEIGARRSDDLLST